MTPVLDPVPEIVRVSLGLANAVPVTRDPADPPNRRAAKIKP
jgi:hypothetical protein